ncbi:MAG: DUF805 domain-containing protein [Clostridiaceae bacterium]|jgi:uncharacterized membrane protein YhaH (DUF805 family)|nr:DUF805 domain-containing protein [Clostridiaceae bacterium]
MFDVLRHEFKNTFNYTGRACRKEIWIFCVTVGLLTGFLGVMITMIGGAVSNMNAMTVGPVISFILMLLFLPTQLSLSARRLHDLNISGWYLVAFIVGNFIPLINVIVAIVGFIMFGCLPGTDEDNKFGPASPLY